MNVPCPVCGGTGRRTRLPLGIFDFAMDEHCNACGGLGYQDDHTGSVFTVTYADAEGMRKRIAELEAEVAALKARLAGVRQFLSALDVPYDGEVAS